MSPRNILLSVLGGAGVIALLGYKVMVTPADWTLFVFDDSTATEPHIVREGYKDLEKCTSIGIRQVANRVGNGYTEARFGCGTECSPDKSTMDCKKVCFKDGTCRVSTSYN